MQVISNVIPLVAVWVTVIWLVVFALTYVVAMFVAALALVGNGAQWPLDVIPVTVTLSDVAAVVVSDAVRVSCRAKAVVAIWVVFVVAPAVGAAGVPVSVGEARVA